MFRKLICLFRRFKFWIRLKITHSSFTLDDFNKLVERIGELLSQHSCTFVKNDFGVFNGFVKK